MDDHGLTEKQLSSELMFQGRVFRALIDRVETPSGKIRTREVIEHPGGAVVLPLLPNGEVLLVRQYRYAPRLVMYEFPAGKAEPGEEALVTIQRELEEETGYMAETWHEITQLYPCPGFCNERLTLFKAEGLSLVENPRREEDEHLHVVQVTLDEVARMIRDRRIVDAKTICLLALTHPEALL